MNTSKLFDANLTPTELESRRGLTMSSPTYADWLERERMKLQGDWFPASNGTEMPFTSRSGKRLLYVWQPSTGHHAYLDLGSDVILSDAEAQAALML